MAATTAGLGRPSKGGDMATTRFTPATFAVMTPMWAEATSDALTQA